MKHMLKTFVKEEQGQDLIEYTLLMAFVASGVGGPLYRRRRQHFRNLECD